MQELYTKTLKKLHKRIVIGMIECCMETTLLPALAFK